MKIKLINNWRLGLLIIVLGVAFYLIWRLPGGEFSTDTPSPSVQVFPKSPISGLSCAEADRRPFAVMLAGDAVARPLSGLGEADLVFNLPVITDSMTRMMAVFVCGSPKEIGSIRSARHDYIPLARGLDAIYAHWGGSHFALEKLDGGVMDNIDALPNPYNAFFRKSGIAAPHNGFTSMERLVESSIKLKYRQAGKFAGYPHFEENIKPLATTTKTLIVGFPGQFEVKYVYEAATNAYARWRGGTKEIDKNTGQQVVAKNVVIMRAESVQIEGQYNDVKVEGQGKAVIYRNGEEVKGIWKKNSADQTSKLFFYDSAGEEIKFVPGQVWVEVVEPSQVVEYK